jgi:hypothetical protein
LFVFLPIGIWYHALFCVTAAILLWLFARFAWPTHLENVQPEPPLRGMTNDETRMTNQ